MSQQMRRPGTRQSWISVLCCAVPGNRGVARARWHRGALTPLSTSHHRGEATFAGSDRQVRGAVVRTLAGRSWSTPDEIAAATGHRRDRVSKTADRMVTEVSSKHMKAVSG